MEGLIDKAFEVVMNKEIGKKLPSFAVNSMVRTVEKTLNMRNYFADPRADDIHINAKDGEETLPPPQDSYGKQRKVNEPELVVKR